MNKEKVIVLDENGLPIYEECSYIKVCNDNLSDVEDFLDANNIPYKSFAEAGRAFCEDEAEFRFRSEIRETEKDEMAVYQKAINMKDENKDLLFDILCDGGMLDDDYICTVISDIFKDNMESDEDD